MPNIRVFFENQFTTEQETSVNMSAEQLKEVIYDYLELMLAIVTLFLILSVMKCDGGAKFCYYQI